MYSKKIAISWPLSDTTGWGVFGTNLYMELYRRQSPMAVLLSAPSYKKLPDDMWAAVAKSKKSFEQFNQLYERTQKFLKLKDTLVLHSLASGFVGGGASDRFEGDTNAGFIFFERTNIDENALYRAGNLDRVLVGSSWNQEVLKANGIESPALVLQGVDDMLFYPRAKTGKYGDKFVVFSAGKLEIRKGQDIVLQAFKIFHDRHPDSILVTAWQNLWPDSVQGIEAMPGIKAGPTWKKDGSIDMETWAVANGIEKEAIVDLGMVPHWLMANEYRDADVAVFTSRAEGGTNLPAMEAMACGIPCVLSKNTGHLDIIDEENCLPLEKQDTVFSPNGSTEGWGSSSVEEVVEHLELLYTQQSLRLKIAQNGAAFMRGLNWRNQVGIMMDELGDLLN